MNAIYHYTDNYILNPMHPVTVNVIGCGGTGSHVLTALARMNEALLALDHMGLFVTAYDPGVFREANQGRQLFSPADLGSNKAVALITNINRSFGNNWRGIPEEYSTDLIISGQYELPIANITISCVDTIAARIEVRKTLSESFRKKNIKENHRPFAKPLYWLDYGNLQQTGQVILSTVNKIKQPSASAVTTLPDIFELFPSMKKQKDDPRIPSCSVPEALKSQDLFINSEVAQKGLTLLWKLFREIKIQYQGVFVNLDTLRSNPIPIR